MDVTVAGQRFTLLNGGPSFEPNPSISFHVHLPDAAAVDALHAGPGQGRRGPDAAGRLPVEPALRVAPGPLRGLVATDGARRRRARRRWCRRSCSAGRSTGGRATAIATYVAALPGSRVVHVEDFGDGEGGEAGTVKQAALELLGQPFVAMDGGPDHAFGFGMGASLQVMCADQAEVDAVATALAADGGKEDQCGWVRDRFGLWWQVVPAQVGTWMASDDEAARDRVFQALLPMHRLDLAALERAYRGG